MESNLVSAALLNPSQPGEGWKVVGTGDMNRDGKKDILFQHTDGTLAVWFMDGINLVQGALLNPNHPGDSRLACRGDRGFDANWKHRSDFSTHGRNVGGLVYGRNQPRPRRSFEPVGSWEEGWRVATTLDLNGDGKTDLLFQHDDGTVAVWLMDGINLILGQLLNPANPGAGWRIVGPR